LKKRLMGAHYILSEAQLRKQKRYRVVWLVEARGASMRDALALARERMQYISRCTSRSVKHSKTRFSNLLELQFSIPANKAAMGGIEDLA